MEEKLRHVRTSFNYILWVQDLLDTTTSDDDYYRASGYDEEREVVGLDMYVWFSSVSYSLSTSRFPRPLSLI